MVKFDSLILNLTLGTMLLIAAILPNNAPAAEGGHSNRVFVYFTRHAEKQATTDVTGSSGYPGAALSDNLDEVCGLTKCAEELSDKGSLRADLLADWFDKRYVTTEPIHAFASHKLRTRQTILPTVELASGLPVTSDDRPDDGIQEFPETPGSDDLNPESTSGS